MIKNSVLSQMDSFSSRQGLILYLTDWRLFLKWNFLLDMSFGKERHPLERELVAVVCMSKTETNRFLPWPQKVSLQLYAYKSEAHLLFFILLRSI